MIEFYCMVTAHWIILGFLSLLIADPKKGFQAPIYPEDLIVIVGLWPYFLISCLSPEFDPRSPQYR